MASIPYTSTSHKLQLLPVCCRSNAHGSITKLPVSSPSTKRSTVLEFHIIKLKTHYSTKPLKYIYNVFFKGTGLPHTPFIQNKAIGTNTEKRVQSSAGLFKRFRQVFARVIF